MTKWLIVMWSCEVFVERIRDWLLPVQTLVGTLRSSRVAEQRCALTTTLPASYWPCRDLVRTTGPAWRADTTVWVEEVAWREWGVEPTEEVSARGPRELLVWKAATLGPGSVFPSCVCVLGLNSYGRNVVVVVVCSVYCVFGSFCSRNESLFGSLCSWNEHVQSVSRLWRLWWLQWV